MILRGPAAFVGGLAVALACRHAPTSPAAPRPTPAAIATRPDNPMDMDDPAPPAVREAAPAGAQENARPEPVSAPLPEEQPLDSEDQKLVKKWSKGCFKRNQRKDCILLTTIYLMRGSPDAEAYAAASRTCALGVGWACSYAGEVLIDHPELDRAHSGIELLKRSCDLGDAAGCLSYAQELPPGSAEQTEARALACRLAPKWYCPRVPGR